MKKYLSKKKRKKIRTYTKNKKKEKKGDDKASRSLTWRRVIWMEISASNRERSLRSQIPFVPDVYNKAIKRRAHRLLRRYSSIMPRFVLHRAYQRNNGAYRRVTRSLIKPPCLARCVLQHHCRTSVRQRGQTSSQSLWETTAAVSEGIDSRFTRVFTRSFPFTSVRSNCGILENPFTREIFTQTKPSYA